MEKDLLRAGMDLLIIQTAIMEKEVVQQDCPHL